MEFLLKNVTEDTVGEPISNTFGSPRNLFISGDLGGGSFTMEGSIDDGITWVSIPKNGVPFVATAPGIYSFDYLGGGPIYRGTLAGSVNPDLTVALC